MFLRGKRAGEESLGFRLSPSGETLGLGFVIRAPPKNTFIEKVTLIATTADETFRAGQCCGPLTPQAGAPPLVDQGLLQRPVSSQFNSGPGQPSHHSRLDSGRPMSLPIPAHQCPYPDSIPRQRHS